MYCKNCGAQMDPNAAICVQCGLRKEQGKSSARIVEKKWQKAQLYV